MSARSPECRQPSTRLLGLDLFRAVAVFGMLVAHVGPSAWTPGEAFGTVHWEWEVFHSRMPAMFAFAAGLSLNLGRSRENGSTQPAAIPTLIRATLLAVCGLLLISLGTPVVVILVSFSVWFVLVLPFRRLGVRALLILTAAWTIAGPALSFLLRQSTALPDDMLSNELVGGDYPALTWMPYVLAGLAVGRLDLSSPQVRLRLAGVGAALMSVGYAVSGFLFADGLTARIMESISPQKGFSVEQQFARMFFGESGVTPTGSWMWLLVPAPHSGSWADVIGCLGVCALTLAVLLPCGDLGRWAGNARCWIKRTVGRLILFVTPLGAMVLSVYAAHIVAMATIHATTGHSFRGAQSEYMLAAFTGGLLVFSWLWMRRFRYGPLEWLLGKATAAIERMGKRVSAGLSRR
ncbi:heparan-alpha-glucosaminide N-acetyltransferase domain-containing protein [Leucobacter sp. M11]|uniref:heparan-alpha-glucosaminide N-acetyltransferase domain-containing protein n=1 Tax=Leucobacter sp. M11 TaxID=2993565 RepID=UPI002D80E694|nr:heparan-alpha-glucosaminide N-acetyltransferase domain-containing protein [Leucobacter sp. M11]MEB4613705.1 heparan-alpha-glucosaminide N-acetyltransferase domain-containing protein [Leucobacter sp. M11]